MRVPIHLKDFRDGKEEITIDKGLDTMIDEVYIRMREFGPTKTISFYSNDQKEKINLNNSFNYLDDFQMDFENNVKENDEEKSMFDLSSFSFTFNFSSISVFRNFFFFFVY